MHKHMICVRLCLCQVPSTLKLPLPMATILYCGKQFPGKLNYVSEFMVVPKPNMPFCKVILLFYILANIASKTTCFLNKKSISDEYTIMTCFLIKMKYVRWIQHESVCCRLINPSARFTITAPRRCLSRLGYTSLNTFDEIIRHNVCCFAHLTETNFMHMT